MLKNPENCNLFFLIANLVKFSRDGQMEQSGLKSGFEIYQSQHARICFIPEIAIIQLLFKNQKPFYIFP